MLYFETYNNIKKKPVELFRNPKEINIQVNKQKGEIKASKQDLSGKML
jgi:hypothetical protein